MEYQPNIDISEILQENPSTTMKSSTMTIPTPVNLRLLVREVLHKQLILRMKTKRQQKDQGWVQIDIWLKLKTRR